MRSIEKFEDGVWVGVEFKELKVGNMIRMFEPDGTPVKLDDEEIYIFEVLKEAYLREDGNLTIDVGPGEVDG
jgi:hypothetical protein